MLQKVLPAEVCDAYEDFCSRTLSRIPSAIERLIYIAATRDYNSGLYHHEGLAARFGGAAAAKALERAHLEIFYVVCQMPLRQLSDELATYMKASREDSTAFLNAWQKLEPYRVAIPMNVNAILAELLISNIKISLAVLRHRLPQETGQPQDASPQLSPAPRSLRQLRN